MSQYSFWYDLILQTDRDAYARSEADQALSLAGELGVDVGQLRSEVQKLREVARTQRDELHRLKTVLAVLGDVLLSRGALEPGELERRISEAIAGEAKARELAMELAKAERAEAARKKKEEEHARANAPVKCNSCGKSFPYHSGFMTERGLVCSDCFQP